MGNRSLVEINHDYTGEIKRDPEGFVRALTLYLQSGHHLSARGLEQFGVHVFGMKHHSDGYSIEWGGKKSSRAGTR